MDRPLPLWMIFPLLFVAVYASHITLLRLPYYWDEAGYYIPAAYDFFRTGSLIPSTTLSNAHPPLPSIYLALWWKASGFMPAVTRVAMCLISAIALLGVFQLGLDLTRRLEVAAVTTGLTLVYPVWFAQSTLAHADMFAAAGTLWGLVFLVESRHRVSTRGPWKPRAAAAIVCFSAAALSKETAIVTPLVLALFEGYQALRKKKVNARTELWLGLLLLLPLIPLVAWYVYHHHRTGFFFGNPEFLSYNATATLIPVRIAFALAHRVFHLTAHMNMFVPVLCAIGAMLLAPRMERDGSLRPSIGREDQAILYVVLVTNVLLFSVIGGALLTRYLLPLYPLVLLLCVSTLWRRAPYWWGLIGLSAVAFGIGLVVNPPYKFAPEDNLNYADVIRLHQQAIRQILTHFSESRVLTAWPATDELSKPELGYVKKAVPVLKIANFSRKEVENVALSGEDYGVVFAFSTKYDPPRLFRFQARNEAFDTRYFGFHRDLDPKEIAALLDARIFWKADLNGEWAAVLDPGHPQAATLQVP